MENELKVYFTMVGEFDHREITRRLGIEPSEAWNIGDKRDKYGNFDFSRWSGPVLDEYDAIAANQMEKVIEPLWSKIDIINKIREELGAELGLVVVASVHQGEITPCLAPSLDVIDFCHVTRCEMDIDLYAD